MAMRIVDGPPCYYLEEGGEGKVAFCKKLLKGLPYQPLLGGIQHVRCPLASEYNKWCHKDVESDDSGLILPDQIPTRDRRVPLTN